MHIWSSVFPTTSCSCFSFRPYLKVFYILWVNIFTEWETWIYFQFSTWGYTDFPATFVEEAVFFSILLFGLICQISLAAWVYVWLLYSNPLVFMSVFVLIPSFFLLLWLCSIVWSLELWSLSIGRFAQNYFGYLRSCVSIWILGFIFISLWIMSLGFW
jgi:hypothetical protein